MATEFTYLKSADFPPVVVSLTVLVQEVLDAGLSAKFCSVNSIGDVVTVRFTTDLTAGEVTTLDGVIAAHAGLGGVEAILAGLDDTVRTVVLDEVGNFTYVGEAIPGTATSTAAWRIFRLDESASGDEELIKTYADNIATFTKVWDDRLTYTYAL